MKRLIFLLLVAFLLGVLLFFLMARTVYKLSWQESKGAILRVFTKERKPVDILRISQGIKYVPAEGQNNFSDGENIYQYYTYEHDQRGKVTKKKTYNITPDNKVIAADEYLKNYIAYENDQSGNAVKDTCYDGRGQDNLWFTSDDVEAYRSAYEYDSRGKKSRVIKYGKDDEVLDYTTYEISPQGRLIKDVVYKGKGPDDQWFTPDDQIEKYHRFDYDSGGNLVRAAEYLVSRNGKGADGIWFTQDDLVSSTKIFSYCATGGLAKIGKYIGPGSDNVWFTDDDKLQYYTIYDEHNEAKGSSR